MGSNEMGKDGFATAQPTPALLKTFPSPNVFWRTGRDIIYRQLMTAEIRVSDLDLSELCLDGDQRK